MSQDTGTGERIYDRLKAAVLTGLLPPHVRLDVARLAAEYGASTTPVREAAMRLLGEGLLQQHPNGGTRPTLATEVRLRTLLQLHERFALSAVDWAIRPIRPEAGEDVRDAHEVRARKFFRSIVAATGNAEFVEVVERLGDRLAPFRHRELQLVPDAAAELAALRHAAAEPVSLRRAIRSYHRRRLKLVAQLVWMASLPGDSAQGWQ